MSYFTFGRSEADVLLRKPLEEFGFIGLCTDANNELALLLPYVLIPKLLLFILLLLPAILVNEVEEVDALPVFVVFDIVFAVLLLKLELNGLLKLLSGLAEGVKQAGGASYNSLCVNCNLPILIGDKGVESIYL